MAGLLVVPKAEIEVDKGGAPGADLLVRGGGHAFVVDLLTSTSPGSVARAT